MTVTSCVIVNMHNCKQGVGWQQRTKDQKDITFHTGVLIWHNALLTGWASHVHRFWLCCKGQFYRGRYLLFLIPVPFVFTVVITWTWTKQTYQNLFRLIRSVYWINNLCEIIFWGLPPEMQFDGSSAASTHDCWESGQVVAEASGLGM